MLTRTPATITWHEDDTSCRGYVTLAVEDGGKVELECQSPITTETNSDEIISLFECHRLENVDHDGECIHCVVVH